MKSYTISFFLRKTKKTDSEKHKIYARVITANHRIDLSVGKKIEANKWNSSKGWPSGKYGYEGEISRYLMNVQERFFKIELELIEQKIPVTAKNLVDRFRGNFSDNDSSIQTLLQAFEIHNKQMQEMKDTGQVARETNGRYRTTKKYIHLMIKQYYKSDDMALRDLNLEFCHKFEKWLRSNTKCANNTIMKYIKNLKKVTRMSVLNGWLDKEPFSFYKCKQDFVAREYLTSDELERLQNIQNIPERIHIVRQLFVLACYTGLSYSDLISLKKADMMLDRGQRWIIKPRKKTRVISRIPVLTIAEPILKELSEHPRSIEKNALVPSYSNQKLNAFLKELASLANISKNLTFHVARHTFATTVTLANGVSLEVVSAQLGHTNIRQTQHYARMVNSRISSEMEKVNKLLG